MATVRRAGAADADAIGHAHVAAWRAAYRGVMDDAFLDGLDADVRAAWWRERVREPVEQHEVLVLVEGGAVQGFAFVGRAAGDQGEHPDDGQVHALNLRPAAWGRGFGRQLLEAAEEVLRRRGHRRAVLWVVAGNERAVRLYERCGWTSDGTSRTERIGPSEITEVRYRREL